MAQEGQRLMCIGARGAAIIVLWFGLSACGANAHSVRKPALLPESERLPLFHEQCAKLTPGRRCHPGKGYCRRVHDDKGKVIPDGDPDTHSRKLQLRAACEAFDIDTRNPCGLSETLNAEEKAFVLGTNLRVTGTDRQSFYSPKEARDHCLRAKRSRENGGRVIFPAD